MINKALFIKYPITKVKIAYCDEDIAHEVLKLWEELQEEYPDDIITLIDAILTYYDEELNNADIPDDVAEQIAKYIKGFQK